MILIIIIIIIIIVIIIIIIIINVYDRIGNYPPQEVTNISVIITLVKNLCTEKIVAPIHH